MSRLSILAFFMTVASLATFASANELEYYFPPNGDPEGQIVIQEGQIFVIGTLGSDEIEVEFRERSIRVTINGEGTTIRQNEVEPIEFLDQQRFQFFVLAHSGDDLIEFVDDFDSDEESFTSSIRDFQILAMAGSGDDIIFNSSVSYSNATLVGGAGSDKITAGFQDDFLIGGLVQVQMENGHVFGTTPRPDYEMDDLIAWKNATIVADYWMSIEASMASTLHRLAPPKSLPGLPALPRGPMIQTSRYFDSVRLERDNVISFSPSNTLATAWMNASGQFERLELDD